MLGMGRVLLTIGGREACVERDERRRQSRERRRRRETPTATRDE
jgi:hypothetical protein